MNGIVKKEDIIVKQAKGYEQLSISQDMPNKTLVSRQTTGTWKLDQHFYAIKTYNKETQGYDYQYRPLLDGKMFIGALAGCRHETRILDRQPDYVRAEATIYYRTPTGEIASFTREKEVSINLERLAAITKKINGELYKLKGKNGDAARYKKISMAAMDIEDESKRQKYLQGELLDIMDIQEINDNMIKLRQTLANMAASKALSSAYTEFLRYVGQRIVFDGKPNSTDEINVTVINTIEIPKAGSSSAPVDLLYGGGDLEDEAIETAHIMKQEISDSTSIDIGTGEIIEESIYQDEPEETEQIEYDGPAELSNEEFIDEIKKLVINKNMGKAKWLTFLHKHTGKGNIDELSREELEVVLSALKES